MIFFGPKLCNVWNFRGAKSETFFVFRWQFWNVCINQLHHLDTRCPLLLTCKVGAMALIRWNRCFFTFLLSPTTSHLLSLSAFLCFPVQLRFLPWACTQCTLHRPLFRSLWTRCKIDSTALSSLKTFSTPASSPEVIPCSLIVDFLYSPNKCTHFSIILKIHF